MQLSCIQVIEQCKYVYSYWVHN